jgi:hypothetical protein
MQTAPKVGRSGEAEEETWLNFDSFHDQFPQGHGESKKPNGRAPAAQAISKPILFHPDYDRRLRHRTGSADPRFRAALAGLPDREPVRLTAGGDFHPALRTSPPRYCGGSDKIGAARRRCNEAQRCARAKPGA